MEFGTVQDLSGTDEQHCPPPASTRLEADCDHKPPKLGLAAGVFPAI
jgi:hypothetical protein